MDTEFIKERATKELNSNLFFYKFISQLRSFMLEHNYLKNAKTDIICLIYADATQDKNGENPCFKRNDKNLVEAFLTMFILLSRLMKKILLEFKPKGVIWNYQKN